MDSDIDKFVSEHKTGSERPAPVLYINYYNPTQPAPEPVTKGNSRGKSEGGREVPNKALPPIPPNDTAAVTGDIPMEDGESYMMSQISC